MANTFTSLHVHFVFSTKNRAPLIADAVKDRLGAFMGGIARENGMAALGVGGVTDHVHLLVSLPPTLAVAKAIQLIKGGSSIWVKETFPEASDFAWQEGYGAFSVSVSHLDETVAYIRNQEEHHRSRSFQDEYRAFLKRHDISCDERYVWG